MPTIPGLPNDLQRALIAMLTLVLMTPNLDADVARRAQWLKWKLEGFDPLTRILVEDGRERPSGRCGVAARRVA